MQATASLLRWLQCFYLREWKNALQYPFIRLRFTVAPETRRIATSVRLIEVAPDEKLKKIERNERTEENCLFQLQVAPQEFASNTVEQHTQTYPDGWRQSKVKTHFCTFLCRCIWRNVVWTVRKVLTFEHVCFLRCGKLITIRSDNIGNKKSRGKSREEEKPYPLCSWLCSLFIQRFLEIVKKLQSKIFLNSMLAVRNAELF